MTAVHSRHASKLALLGGTPIGSVPADPHPRFSRRAIQKIVKLLEKGRVLSFNRGSEVLREAEAAIARWQRVKHILTVSSGHAALHSAVIGLEIGPGDEVITTPYTWGASISCILHNGAVPVFADVDPETGLLDPRRVEALITRRTRAILAVHIYGQAANMTALCRLAKKHGLAVIEDGSQAHGSIHAGKKVGTFGDAAGFSCMGGKLLATTEGGYLATRDPAVYWKAALSTQHMARSGDPGFPEELRPYVDSLVYTYRTTAINSVLFAEQVKKLDRENQGRRENVALLRKNLRGCQVVSFPEYPRGDKPAYHILTMNFNEDLGIQKSTLFQAMRAEGIGISSYVSSPISTWKRLQWWNYRGPKVMWMENLKRNGIRYDRAEVPHCVLKIRRAIEMGWNYTVPSPAKMRKLASAFYKVEENLDALRAWERKQAK
ncbi:MAG: DegT/DnrJ/EryC1/StrS family aminotransferase [Planctomycetes bacterium]|nr:DegT/DnrJ/EryC1/StrS family aminotransferase [Planctomycetota bacterium]